MIPINMEGEIIVRPVFYFWDSWSKQGNFWQLWGQEMIECDISLLATLCSVSDDCEHHHCFERNHLYCHQKWVTQIPEENISVAIKHLHAMAIAMNEKHSLSQKTPLEVLIGLSLCFSKDLASLFKLQMTAEHTCLTFQPKQTIPWSNKRRWYSRPRHCTRLSVWAQY